MKDSRKVEEMILHFVTCSVKTLKKSIENPDDYRRIRDEQTYWFMLVFREAVVTATPSATELISKLDGYVRNMKAEYEKVQGTAAPPKLERNNTELYQQGGSMVKIATRLFGTRSDHAAVLASSRVKVSHFKRLIRGITDASSAIRMPSLRLPYAFFRLRTPFLLMLMLRIERPGYAPIWLCQ